MDLTTVLSSAVVAAIVTGVLSYLRERQILDRKAEVDYRSNARRRLYEAIGPLRLHLLFAARDVVDRVVGHVAAFESRGAGWSWNLDPREYYARSFAYRLLRPLAIGQLIQRQMSTADFAVDTSSLDLLRFDQAASRMLTGDEILLEHPLADWNRQTDHLFGDNLRRAAASLVAADGDGEPRIIDFAEFTERLDGKRSPDALEDLLAIFGRCTGNLGSNPIFWLRVVGYGHAWNNLLAAQGTALGFRPRTYDGAEMLRYANDDTIRRRAAEHVAAFEVVVNQGL